VHPEGGGGVRMVHERRLLPHGGHSVLPNRTVRFLGNPPNSVPEELGTDRFLRRPGTELFGIGSFRFGSGIYRNYRTTTTNKGRQQSANNNKQQEWMGMSLMQPERACNAATRGQGRAARGRRSRRSGAGLGTARQRR
jgi:hypothetical protein